VVGEECDDGNTTSGDGCSERCEVESGWVCFEDPTLSVCAYTCGDGVLDPLSGEECDDGVENSDTAPDACRERCVAAACGDGVIDAGEECDDGEENSARGRDACRPDCRLPFCGDGVLDEGEYCDRTTTVDEMGRFVAQPIETCTAACLPDGGELDAGLTADAGAVIDRGGCSCRVGRARPTGLVALAALLALLVLRRRR
jgi:MYXO-CTERM domain-containing protein